MFYPETVSRRRYVQADVCLQGDQCSRNIWSFSGKWNAMFLWQPEFYLHGR